MYKKKPLIILLVLIPFLVMSSSNALPAEKEFSLQWHTMTRINGNTLRSVWGSIQKGEISIFAVGDKGTILHYDGNTKLEWARMESGTEENLHGVWGSIQKGEISIFAVGDKGTIRRYDGNAKLKWAEIKSGNEENLHGIWGTSSDNIYTVSETGTVRHYDMKKRSMSQMQIRAGVNLNGICGSVQEDGIHVFAVGDGGTILPYDNTRRSIPMGMKSRTDANLNGIWGSDDGDFFAVGDKGTIRHYSAKENSGKERVKREWVEKKSPTTENLRGIWGTSGNNIYAVGDNGTVIHYSGQEWLLQKQETKPTTENLYAVWVSANPHVFVVGANGFTAQTWSAIWGWIYDSCAGTPIPGAAVRRLNESGQFVPYASSGPDGRYDCPVQHNCELPPGQHTFQFIANGFSPVEKKIDIIPYNRIEFYTYLLPTNNYQSCVSGVISENIIRDGGRYSQFMNTIPVALYQKNCSTWSEVGRTYTSTAGRYKFTITVAGTYKVVPENYIFYPEYDNIAIVIPQDASTFKSYDFIRD